MNNFQPIPAGRLFLRGPQNALKNSKPVTVQLQFTANLSANFEVYEAWYAPTQAVGQAVDTNLVDLMQ